MESILIAAKFVVLHALQIGVIALVSVALIEGINRVMLAALRKRLIIRGGYPGFSPR